MLPSEMDTIMAFPHIFEKLFFLIRLEKREGTKCVLIFRPAMTHSPHEKFFAFVSFHVVQFRDVT